ncbi:MAG: hypothetical protein ACM33V_14190, partial [Chloroflexota bacterium]
MSAQRLNTNFFITAYFIASGNSLQLVQYSDPQRYEATIPRGVELSLSDMESFLNDGAVQINLQDASSLPPPLAAYTRQLGCESAAYVPILQKGKLRGFVLIGARTGQEIDEEVVNAFARTIRLTTNVMELVGLPAQPLNDRRSLERK